MMDGIDLVHTGSMLSVMACDPGTGELGIALASSSIAIGSRCPHMETGQVAVASQGFTNLKVGPLALDLIGCGLTPLEVIEALRQHDRWLDYRQIGIVTADGRIEAHTGGKATGWAGHRAEGSALCMGNGLPDGTALDIATGALRRAGKAPMAERLLRALEAVKTALGDGFPVISSALLVRSPLAESQIDLRIDRAHRPLDEGGDALRDLRALYLDYLPLVEIYAARSVAPRAF